MMTKAKETKKVAKVEEKVLEKVAVVSQTPVIDFEAIIEQMKADNTKLSEQNAELLEQNVAQLEQSVADQEAKNFAYWERNMLALLLANQLNDTKVAKEQRLYQGRSYCGWYGHQGEGFEGWSRVVSLSNGSVSFHVPDSFDLGYLPEIQPNWDGHTTEEKWSRVKAVVGVADSQ